MHFRQFVESCATVAPRAAVALLSTILAAAEFCRATA